VLIPEMFGILFSLPFFRGQTPSQFHVVHSVLPAEATGALSCESSGQSI